MNLEAPIVAVTVYGDRARVTRRGTAHLSPGEGALVIPNVPTTLQEDSIRASGKGAHAKILGVDVVTQYVTDPPEASLAELEKQLKALQAQDQTLVDENARLDGTFAFLKGLRESSGARLAKGLASGKASLESVQALASYLGGEFDRAAARRREIVVQRQELARELEALQARLDSARGGRAMERREIRVLVEAAEETDVEIQVMYAVRNASWEPLYDLRLVESTVTCTYLANVRQQTGEDWPAVGLALSTARPAESSRLPELDPWYIQKYEPPPPVMPSPKMYMRAASSGAGAPQPAPMAMMAPPPMEISEAQVENGGAAVTYRVPRPIAIPSDNSPHKTTVAVFDLKARLDYLAIPKLAEEAYLRARVVNNSEYIFLPGLANVMHSDEFVGATRLETVVPQQEFELQLGVDDRIQVERELTERAVAKAMIGSTRRTVFGYKITLTNHLARAAHVTAQDQMPVSRHEEIRVKLQEAMPKPAETTDLNVLKWEMDLAAGQKVEISFSFSVEYPKDMRITGLGE